MRKTLMAVAVAGALAAPGVAMAQASTVQIFGTIHVIYSRTDAGTYAGAPVGERTKMDHLTQSDSEIGFRGEEALGGGMSAWFQCASTLDAVGTAGTTNTASFCGRNSAIGIKGGFGNVFWGIWDTPEKLMFTPIRGWFGYANVLGGAGNLIANASQSGVFNPVSTAVGAATNAGYARRQNRLISFHSNVYGGFQGLVAYSATNEATATTTNQIANKARLWSASGMYNNGPIYAAVAYERHHNYNPGVGVAVGTTATTYSGGNDNRWSIGGAYTFAGIVKVSANYNWFKYHISNSADMRARTWMAAVDWTIAGPHSLKAMYTKLQDTSGSYGGGGVFGAPGLVGLWTANGGAGGTGAKQYNLAYAYAFSKRTTGYLGYSRISNSMASTVTLAGSPATAGLSPGESQSVYGMGIRHSF